MKRNLGFILVVLWASHLWAQSPADSVRITFRAHQPAAPTVFVPGGFNGWGPNSGGAISPGAPSEMSYDGGLGAWVKTYTFRTHAPGDAARTLGDSVYQYKFNRGGGSTGWYSDPLNPEINLSDNNNSILRLTRLFWFQYLATESAEQITRVTVGLVHANSDTIASITLTTGETQTSALTTSDVLGSYSEGSRLLDVTLGAPIPRAWYLRLVARTTTGDSVVLTRGGIVVPQVPLPAYANHGVTLPSALSNDSTTFRLRVPGKDAVWLRLAPSGNDLGLATPILLRHAPGSDNWWTNVSLPAGNTYEYLYELDNGRLITDPWGRWVGDNGTKFSTGPGGLTADDYTWSSAGFVRPPINRIVLYELHLGEFAGGAYGLGAGQAGFLHLATLMKHFDSLGVNAIELMPVNDFGSVGRSGHSWGYDLNSYTALEPSYGTPGEFKALVDSAHMHGIAVVVDVVFNHLNDTSPLWQMLPDEAANPYFKSISDVRPNEDQLAFFKDMDHWAPETQELIYGVLKMWLDVYHVDGFRYDYTQGIGWDVNAPTKGILGWANRINQEYGGLVYQIAEHLPESPALLAYSGLTSGWHDSFRDKVFDEARFRNVPLPEIEGLVLGLGAFTGNDTPALPSSYANRTEPVNATVTHDEQSLIFEMVNFQSFPEADAVQRDKLYGTFMFTSLGIPMLWEGMEFSEPRGWAQEALKLAYRPVQWSMLGTPRGRSHFAWYRALARQRTMNPALYRGVFRPLHQYTAQNVYVWGFEDTLSTAKVMIVANLRGIPHTVTAVPWLGTGTWTSIADGTTMAVSTATIDTMVIPPYTALVYSTIPDGGLTEVRRENTAALPTELGLDPNYPNPFNPSTNLAFTLPAAGRVSLVVYDLLGREVARLAEGTFPAGRFTAVWDGRSLRGDAVGTGMYIARLTATDAGGAERVMSRKMLLVK